MTFNYAGTVVGMEEININRGAEEGIETDPDQLANQTNQMEGYQCQANVSTMRL